MRGRRGGAERFQQPQGGVRQASLARGWRQSRPLLAPHVQKLTSNYAPSADAQTTVKVRFVVDRASQLRLGAALGCVLGAPAAWWGANRFYFGRCAWECVLTVDVGTTPKCHFRPHNQSARKAVKARLFGDMGPTAQGALELTDAAR